MQTTERRDQGRRVVVAVLAKGDEALAGITQAARSHRLGAAQITAMGAFARAEVGYLDRDKGHYDHIPIDEQVEVLSLFGDVATKDGTPVVRAHTVLGRRDGSVVGGRLLAGQVWPTLEVILTEVASELAKRVDPETGLALIDLDMPR